MSRIELTDHQIDLVADRLDQEGLQYEVLRLELLDHICCQVESLLEAGDSFGDALDKSMTQFGPQSPKQVESDLISTLNHPHILMQKLMLTGSVLTAVLMLFVFWAKGQNTPSMKPLENTSITSSFGMRVHPRLKKKQHHTGVDLRADEGTPIYAPADGTVNLAGIDPERKAFGILIQITHDTEFETRYAHLSKVAVEPGQTVKAGDLIGYTGNTGKSLGPHLHYEVRKDGKPVNPEDYFRGEK